MSHVPTFCTPVSLTGTGGLRLHATRWAPVTPPHARVLLVHGLAEHSGRYDELIGRLVAAGHVVYGLDHRGHGRSDGPRAYVERFEHYVTDLGRLHAVADADGELPTVIVGHSMGGAIAFDYALRHPDRVARLVLSAPLLATDPSPPRLQLAAARLLARFAPRTGALKLPADTISRDPVVVRAYENDPLVYRGAIPARTLVELLAITAGFPGRAATLRVPVLILHGTGDRLVQLEHCRPVYVRIPEATKTLRVYDGLYHELFNEPERVQVYAEVERWLAAPPG